MFYYNNSVKFITISGEIEAKVLMSSKQSYLLWDGENTIWANEKRLEHSNNEIRLPIPESLVDMYRNSAENLLRNAEHRIRDRDIELLKEQVAGAMIRALLYGLFSPRSNFQDSCN